MNIYVRYYIHRLTTTMALLSFTTRKPIYILQPLNGRLLWRNLQNRVAIIFSMVHEEECVSHVMPCHVIRALQYIFYALAQATSFRYNLRFDIIICISLNNATNMEISQPLLEHNNRNMETSTIRKSSSRESPEKEDTHRSKISRDTWT